MVAYRTQALPAQGFRSLDHLRISARHQEQNHHEEGKRGARGTEAYLSLRGKILSHLTMDMLYHAVLRSSGTPPEMSVPETACRVCPWTALCKEEPDTLKSLTILRVLETSLKTQPEGSVGNG